MYYIAYHLLQSNEKENLPLGQSEPTTAELLEIEHCNLQIAEHERIMAQLPHLFVGDDERRFTPRMLLKPFDQVLMETNGGRMFVREVNAGMAWIQSSQEAAKLMFINSLTKALKDEEINKEALLQLVLMSNNKVSALENLDNCQILKEISQRWNLSKYPEEKTFLHSAVKGMFEERKRLSMIETNKLEEKKVELREKHKIATSALAATKKAEELEILRKKALESSQNTKKLETKDKLLEIKIGTKIE